MSERSRGVVLSIWVFVIPAVIVLLSVGTLDSGAGANAAPGGVSSTGTQQSGSTTALGGQTAKSDACIDLIDMGPGCDCSGISCQCEDGACVTNYKMCNNKYGIEPAPTGALTAYRVKRHCFIVYQCRPWDEIIGSRSACSPSNPCWMDEQTDKSETTFYTWMVSGDCGGIETAP